MTAAQLDLARLMEQCLALIDEILDLSSKLVLEVKAEHYWTTFSLETQSQLKNITRNLAKMLDLTKPNWSKGEELFATEEGMKLWRTASGLLRALPKVRSRYVEQLARRRRQRIMGQELEDLEELDPEVLAREEEQFRTDQGELRRATEALQIMMEGLPEELAPNEDQLAEALGRRKPAAPSKDQQPESEPAAEQAQAGNGDQASPAAAEAPPAAEPDDFSPV